MTLPEVLRVALIKTGPQVEQRFITQPSGHGICPQVETCTADIAAEHSRHRLQGYLAQAE